MYLDTRKKRAGNPTLVTIVKINCAQSTESPKASFKKSNKETSHKLQKEKSSKLWVRFRKSQEKKEIKEESKQQKKRKFVLEANNLPIIF